MDNHQYIINDAEFDLTIGKGVTQLVTGHQNGLRKIFKLLMFNANEPDRNITVRFRCYLVPEGNINDVLAESTVEFTLSEDDYDFFEDNIGIPIVKKSILNGLLDYHFGVPKYFDEAPSLPAT
ncbi:hypothetical protein [Rufibacter ruber]|uniref:hypothetical protein n=1 Tax=Rufibacter ruber TaxID=1783499 RepID=UPI000831900F|nr:hypothetical protein [Rufibacter ruber]